MSFFEKTIRNVSSFFLGTITHVATDDPIIALTFDDGPDPITTPMLLDVLESYGAKATFFMTGESAEAHPEIAAAVGKGGHAVGNHSWNHPSFPLITGSERRRQIRSCANVLHATDTLIFRPPYGHQSVASRKDAFLTRHEVVTWSVCVPDWLDHDGEWLADFALQRMKGGSVVLMHDGMVDFLGGTCKDRKPTVDAVGRILAALRDRFEFVTVPELLRRGKPVRSAWWMEPDIGFLNSLNRKSGIPRRYQLP